MEITQEFLNKLITALNLDAFDNPDQHIPSLHSSPESRRLPELEGEEANKQLRAFILALKDTPKHYYEDEYYKGARVHRETLYHSLDVMGVPLSVQSEWWTELAMFYLDLIYLETIDPTNLPNQDEIGQQLFLDRLSHPNDSLRNKLAVRALNYFKKTEPGRRAR